MDGINRENGDEERFIYKNDFSFAPEMSPRSPLSTRSRRSDSYSLDLAIDGAVDTSIEQLYNNVYQMQSSDDSESASYLSYGEESRIDSELCHLVGDFGNWEIAKEEKKEEICAPVDDLILKKEDSPGKKAVKASNRQFPTRNCSNLKKVSFARESDGAATDNPEVGRFLLKQVQGMLSSGQNPRKALALAIRARNSLEKSVNGKPGLEMVMCLHVLAALYCTLGEYSEAIPVLERSIEIPVVENGVTDALAKFAGCMQLGDTYAMVGKLENSISCYGEGLEIQKRVLGPTDPRVGETCRYVAEANVQALQFDEAEKFCQMALDIHRETGNAASSTEEAADRRLMGLILESKGEHEASLEHYVLASMAMASHGQEIDVAALDCSIGDVYLALARFDEAVFAYKKAVKVYKSVNGENHPAVASVLVRLADLYNKIGKFKASKSYCENALRIYRKPSPGFPPEEIAAGLIDIAAIYQSVNETDTALKLLKKALSIYNAAPGQQSSIAGIEAQIGVMYYMMGNYDESYEIFKNAVSKFRTSGEKKSAWFGIALNQMGLACVQKYAITEAADFFEEAKCILEKEYGPYHPETLGVYTNLAATYDAMGRWDEAIEILEFVIGMREEKLGTANPDVYDEKKRLAELLKEAGRERSKKSRSLVKLLDSNIQNMKGEIIRVL